MIVSVEDSAMEQQSVETDSTLTQNILETKDKRGRYSCLKCDARSKSLKRVKIHFDLLHMKERNFECASCDYKASLRSTIRTHILSKHGAAPPPKRKEPKTRNGLLKCDKCPFTCFRPLILKRHNEEFIFHNPADSILEGSVDYAYACPRCEFRSNSLLSMKRHHKIHGAREEMACSYCEFKTVLHTKFVRHMRTEHSVMKPYKCSVCSYESARVGELKGHVTSIHSKDPNQADSTLTQTILETKDKRGRYSCLKCDASSKSIKRLKIHFDLVHMKERNFECASCDYKASLRSTIRTHIHSKHGATHPPQRMESKTRMGPLKCDKCPFSCIQPSNLKRHNEKFLFHNPADSVLEGSASNAYAYACPRCKFTSKNLNSTRKHYKKLHKDRQQMDRQEMACSYWEFKTTTHTKFTHHMSTAHSGLKPYTCSQCSYKSSRGDALKRHVTLMHLNRSNRAVYACLPRKRGADGKYDCPICEFRSAHPMSLRRHFLVLHTDEKRYPCTLCEFKAKTLDIINYHVDTKHGGEGKPLACAKCKFTCFTSNQMIIHVKAVHSKNQKERLPKRCISIELDGTYTCTLCNFLSNDLLGVRRHLAENHPGCDEFTCHFCGFKTDRRSKMKHHLDVKHAAKKPLKCDKCAFTCVRTSQLKTHAFRCHVKRDLECPFIGSCAFKTRHGWSLRRHISTQHNNNNNNGGL